jgi:hypothetical protein
MRSAIEQLLGRPIENDEEISIAAIPPQAVPKADDRRAVAEKLEALLNRRADKVRDLPPDDLDAAINEALDHLRHVRQ